jgi:short-subunit dehydrogenase
MNKKYSKGQLAVVTGASSGIGFELAKQFAMNGFDLIICAEDDGIAEAAHSFEQYGNKVDFLRVDLSTEEGVEKFYQKIKSSGRAVDSIAINAGVGVGGASFDKTDIKKELNLLRLNVLSTVHLTKLILPDMLEVGHGRILFTSSVAAFMPGPFESVYSASKAFIQSFAEAVREETKNKGIVITALQPGPTETNFFHRADMDNTKVGKSKKDNPALVAQQGFEALMKERHATVAGSIKNKFEANIARVLPQKIAAKIHRSMTKPVSPRNQ